MNRDDFHKFLWDVMRLDENQLLGFWHFMVGFSGMEPNKYFFLKKLDRKTKIELFRWLEKDLKAPRRILPTDPIKSGNWEVKGNKRNEFEN